MKFSEALLLLAAGTLGGILSTAVSIASLVTYPALLALGVPPLSANMTNTVSLVLTAVLRMPPRVPAASSRSASENFIRSQDPPVTPGPAPVPGVIPIAPLPAARGPEPRAFVLHGCPNHVVLCA